MKRIIFLVFFSVMSLLMTGCAATPPSQSQILAADYGKLPNDYQEQIKSYLSSILKDPYSAKYSFEAPFKGYSQDGSWSPSGGKVSYGYVVGVQVNAKNSYGGYTGNQLYVFIFSGNVLYNTSGNFEFGRVKKVSN